MSSEVEYNFLSCTCGCKFEVKAYIQRGFKDNEEINCPKCNEYVTTIRADMGYDTRILSEEGLFEIEVETRINRAAVNHIEGQSCVFCHEDTTSFIMPIKDSKADSIACCRTCFESSDFNNEDNLHVSIEED